MAGLRQSTYSRNIKNPMILPRNLHVTELVIRHFHEKSEHQGCGLTTNTLRTNGFWVIVCSKAVLSIIHKYITCRRLRSLPQKQKMANLPEDRFESLALFTYCGVDFFRPWHIKEGWKELKRYGALFTCMTSRAIHIETANILETDSFINALRCFLAIEGQLAK